MPKPSSFPSFLDEVNNVSITDLRKWGYLNEGSLKSGTVTWSRFGEVTSSIGIKVDYIGVPFLELDYKWCDKEINYRVYLVSVPSNLGKGEVLYFYCPFANKRCRKLYFSSGYFMHREATGLMYEQQARSKSDRAMIQLFHKVNTEPLHKELYSKGFTKFYNGKPTKRYQKIINKLQKANSYHPDTFYNLLRGKV